VKEKRKRVLELLSDKALGELNEAELAEIRKLEEDHPELKEIAESFELTVAAISLTNLEVSEPLPLHLREKLLKVSDEYFTEARKQVEEKKEEKSREQDKQKVLGFERGKTPSPFFAWLGWAVAGAACIALAINIWLTHFSLETKKEPNLAQQREKILQMPDAIRLEWKHPGTKETLGDLVWSNSAQKGFARFYKLPANEPEKETYQFWVIDESQKSPTDAGLFNVTTQGEVIFPIETRIKVDKPKMFAITVEKPGGVVIPSLDKIIAVAEVKTEG
jgi:anti-sigma-K factor RskA